MRRADRGWDFEVIESLVDQLPDPPQRMAGRDTVLDRHQIDTKESREPLRFC
jgi:hypothetical protein